MQNWPEKSIFEILGLSSALPIQTTPLNKFHNFAKNVFPTEMKPITRVAKEKNKGGKEKKREENNIFPFCD